MTLTSKINAFSDSLQNALENLQKRDSNYNNTDLLQQNNITFLKNELKSKDKINQSLLERQTALTSSLSNLKAKQHEPIVNLAKAKQSNLRSSIKKNQSSRQQKQQSLGNQKKIILGQDELDTLYVRNLSENVNESDLFELFGLRTTNYLRDNSDVKIPFSENTGKRRGSTYVKVPRDM